MLLKYVGLISLGGAEEALEVPWMEQDWSSAGPIRVTFSVQIALYTGCGYRKEGSLRSWFHLFFLSYRC
jgi:hypothetical protein